MKPTVYIVLGAAGSGRREVLLDLLSEDLDEKVAVFMSGSEAASPADEGLNSKATLLRWTMVDESVVCELPSDAGVVFFLADGNSNPVDFLEKMPGWLTAHNADLGRVISVVNCQLAEKHPALRAWYEACIHFSDVVLLNKREGVANKWMSDFTGYFRDKCVPAYFEMLKTGRIKNPALILDTQPRRMTLIFDEDEMSGLNLEGVEFGEESDDGEEQAADKEPEDGWVSDPEPYFERNVAGRRLIEIPDIAVYLKK